MNTAQRGVVMRFWCLLEITDMAALEQALSTEYTLPIITDNWQMPKGAFGMEGCGAV